MSRYKPKQVNYSNKITIVNDVSKATVEVGYTEFAKYDELLHRFDKVVGSINDIVAVSPVKGIAKLDPKDEYDEQVGIDISYKRALLNGLRQTKGDLKAALKAVAGLADFIGAAILDNEAEQEKLKASIQKLGNRQQ